MGVPIVAGRSFEPAMGCHQAGLSLSTKRWRIGSGKGVTDWAACAAHLSAAIGFGDNAWHTVMEWPRTSSRAGRERDGTELYVSLDQLAMAAPTMNVVLRTILRRPPCQTLERLVREVDPAVPIVRFRDMESVFADRFVGRSSWRSCWARSPGWRCFLRPSGDTYGVLSYMATERRPWRSAFRSALGAVRSSVVAAVMSRVSNSPPSVVVGLAGALGAESA